MNRRRFLGMIAGSLAPSALTGSSRAWAQARPGGVRVPPPEPPVGRSATASVDAQPGVTMNDLRIGMSAAFRGTAAGLGTEFYRGAQAYYNDVNGKGGVHGRAISVVALDDGYEPIPCVKNTIRLLEKEPVFVLSNYVGTPTLTRALPVIKRYSESQVVLVGNFTGAQPQREAPYAEHVFNIRPRTARR